MSAAEGFCISPRPLLCLLALVLLPGLARASRDFDDSNGLEIIANETQALGTQEHQPLQTDHEKRAGTPEYQGEAAVQVDPGEDLAVVLHAVGRMTAVKAHGMPLPASAFVRSVTGVFTLDVGEAMASIVEGIKKTFDVVGKVTEKVADVVGKVADVTGDISGVLDFTKGAHKVVTKGLVHVGVKYITWGGILAGGVGFVEGISDLVKGDSICWKVVAGAKILFSLGGAVSGILGFACPPIGIVGGLVSTIWDFFLEDTLRKWCESKDAEPGKIQIPMDMVKEVVKDEPKPDEMQKMLNQELKNAVTANAACNPREAYWDLETTRKIYKTPPQPPKAPSCPNVTPKNTIPKITFTYSDGHCPWVKTP